MPQKATTATQAQTVAEGIAAGERYIAPAQNLTLVDRETIAMKTIGALPRRDAPSAVLGWVGAEDEAAVAGIARKLRHYGRQGYVVFDTPSLQAALQGEWAALDSPLGVVLDPAGANTPLRLPPTPPLEP